MGRKAQEKLERRMKGGGRAAPCDAATPTEEDRRNAPSPAVLGGVGAWLWNGARATPPEPAPRFNLWASTGRGITLDDYLGKQEVVLFFFMGAG